MKQKETELKMKNAISSMMEMLELNIKNEIKNFIKKDFNEEFEELIIDVLNKKNNLATLNSNLYLSEKDLLSKYKTSKTFLYKVRENHIIDRFKCGRFFMYSETDFIQACKNYNPQKPKFINRIEALKLSIHKKF